MTFFHNPLYFVGLFLPRSFFKSILKDNPIHNATANHCHSPPRRLMTGEQVERVFAPRTFVCHINLTCGGYSTIVSTGNGTNRSALYASSFLANRFEKMI